MSLNTAYNSADKIGRERRDCFAPVFCQKLLLYAVFIYDWAVCRNPDC